MKNRSIRFKLTAWFALMLIVIVAITFFMFRVVSASVLRSSLRDHLIGSVESNVDDVTYIKTASEARNLRGNSILIEHDGGFLEIDDDFLDVIDDVQTSLYTTDGSLVYGTNPIAQALDSVPLTQSRLWQTTEADIRYEVYERTLPVEGTSGLWIRGVMPTTQEEEQLYEITRILMVLIPALVVLSLMGGYFSASRLLRPVREIEQAAAEISEGDDLRRRIQMEGPDDELHRLADTFDDMMERLENAFEGERRFTADASHELRTPMSVILAQCEYTLSKDNRTPEEYTEALRTIRRQGARMNGLINDMLDYTRMEQKAERYPLSGTDMSLLTREICAEMAMLRTNDITLYARVPDGIMVNGSRILLTRLLQNLISNAYRYGREGGAIEVRLSHAPGGGALLEVEDNGIGIEADQLPKIFDRFFRADSSRTRKGTGLGLSMVKRIVEIHCAQIRVTSTPGTGTTFTIIFPAYTEAEGDGVIQHQTGDGVVR
ncbi:MAG: HAMP domain-containing histidine kinase [Lachnospiraceae bacterium]|nr:HAMP domain-containing histidine kinase [Lachnospiraceae bacterium]